MQASIVPAFRGVGRKNAHPRTLEWLPSSIPFTATVLSVLVKEEGEAQEMNVLFAGSMYLRAP